MTKNRKQLIKYIIFFLIAAVLIYVVTYCCFLGDGFLSAGKDMEKKDWLGFFGAYLSFIGTVAVSIAAALQSSYYNKRENQRRAYERFELIQPIFSIDISERNSHVGNYALAINPSDSSTFPRFDNFTLKIKNLGEYPALHICIFEKYMFPVIDSKEEKKILVAFEDSEDVKKYPKGIPAILPLEDMDRGGERLPYEFNIAYDDIDGNSVFQTFKLMDFEEKKYYSLKKREVTVESEKRNFAD